MTLLSRYIFREFIRLFLTALIAIIIVYVCVDFLQRADRFIKYKATISQVSQYFLYSLPSMIAPSTPFAALVATLLSLGNLSRYNEIIAMRASGVSLMKIVTPVFLGGLLISAIGFFNNESIMPRYTAKAQYLRNVEIEKKQQMAVFQQSKLWLRGPDNSIANIELISPDRNEMLGLNIYKLNPDYTVKERIKAGSLLWKDGAWRLQDSWKYVPAPDGSVAASPADGEIFNIVESPDELGMIAKDSEEMKFSELWDYVRRLKSSGYNAVPYEVDLQGKLAFPLSSLLMVMIATPLSLQRARSGGAGKAIAIAVLIAFTYWAVLTVGAALGRSAVLPPVAAAWLANVVFAAASFFVLFRMQRTN